MPPLSGYNDRLPDDVLLNTGVLFAGNHPLGITRGGPVFDPGITYRQTPYDGQLADRVGLDRRVYYKPHFTGQLVQFGTDDMSRLEPGGVQTSPGGNVTTRLTPIAAGTYFTSGQYVTNLRLVYQRGSGGFVQVRMAAALCEKWTVKGTDREEGLVDFDFAGKAAAADAEGTAPYVIEYLSAVS